MRLDCTPVLPCHCTVMWLGGQRTVMAGQSDEFISPKRLSVQPLPLTLLPVGLVPRAGADVSLPQLSQRHRSLL